VGNSWYFLNEYTDKTTGDDILYSGFGNDENTTSFQVGKTFYVYLPATASRLNNKIIYDNLQIKTLGYEADAIDNMMGHIIPEYSRDGNVVSKFFGEHLQYLKDHGGADDEIGTISKLLNPLVIDQENNTGEQTLHSFYIQDKVSYSGYDIIYRIKEIPYSATVGGRAVNR
jgi:hypothetical protein